MIRLYTAAEAAEILQATSSWLKEQARLRRIPFVKISGQYRWSEDHLLEIARLHEVRPETAPPSQPRHASRPTADNGPGNGSPTVPNAPPLRARPQQKKKQAPAGASGEGPEKKGA